MTIAHEVMTAGSEFFTPLTPSQRQAKYRRYARALHPDLHPEPESAEAFARLNALYEAVRGNGTADTSRIGVRVNTTQHEYVLTQPIQLGAFTHFEATYDNGHKVADVLVTSTIEDNDLMERHVSAHRKIVSEVPSEYLPYYVPFLEGFRIEQPTGTHGAVAHKKMDGFYSVEDLLLRGLQLDSRNIAWIFRRLLVSIGNAHDINLVNMSVTPDNVFIHPTDHGLFIPMWDKSCEGTMTPSGTRGSRLVWDAPIAINRNYRDLYPEDFLDNREVSTLIDIQMGAETMLALLDDRGITPEDNEVRTYLQNLAYGPRVHHDGQDAGVILSEFTQLLARVYGAPKYVTFSVD